MHITRTSWSSHYTQIFAIPTWLYIWQNCLLLTVDITGLRGNFNHEDSYLGPLAWFMRSDNGDRTLLNIVSTAHYLPRRAKKKNNRKHDLNQERIHGWPKYYKKIKTVKTSDTVKSLSNCVIHRTVLGLRNRTGEERRRQTLCDKRDNDFVRETFPPIFTFL